MKDHPDEWTPSWKTTLMQDHPDDRPLLFEEHYDESIPFLHDDAGHPSAGHQASKHSMLVVNEISAKNGPTFQTTLAWFFTVVLAQGFHCYRHTPFYTCP